MATSSEIAWAALAERLAERCSSFKTITRSVGPGKAYGHEQKPALEIWDNGTEDPRGNEDGLLLGWTLSGELAIVAAPDAQSGNSPFSMLNDLVAEVLTALERQPSDVDTPGTRYYGQGSGHFTNLGGLIEAMGVGTVTKGGGSETEVVAKIPIQMDT